MISLDEDAAVAALDLIGRSRCRCGSLVALSDAGATFYRSAHLADGTRWDEADARAAGQCRWTREGRRWYGACGAGR